MRGQDQPGVASDWGYTTIELLVAMGMFLVVITVFMSGLVVMTKSTARNQATADASDGLRRAFQQLDREVRYADSMNLPGAGGAGRTYIEFRQDENVSPSGVTTCIQWRWNPTEELLETRSWAASAATLPAFRTVATNIVGATPIFTMVQASPQRPHQELIVNLTVQRPSLEREVSSQSTFVARNSDASAPGNLDNNHDGLSDAPTCWRAGIRP